MIDLRTIVKGVLTRFFPGFVVGVAALLVLGALTGGIGIGWVIVIQQAAVMGAGYFLALAALRYRLHASADVSGRRSFIAGFLSPPAVLTAMVIFQADSTTSVLAVSALMGGAIGLAMFFPWLKPQPVAALTDDEARALLAESAIDWDGATAAHAERAVDRERVVFDSDTDRR